MNELLKCAELADELDQTLLGLEGEIAIELEDVLEELDDICVNVFAEDGDVWFEFDMGESEPVMNLIDQKTDEIEEVTGSRRYMNYNIFKMVEDFQLIKKTEDEV